MSKEHIIYKITPGSIAEEMEIEPGDVLVSINGNDVVLGTKKGET